jgi:hypothetical protein
MVPVVMLRNGFEIQSQSDFSRILMDILYLKGEFHGHQDLMIMSEMTNKTLLYPLTSWIFDVFDTTSASYVGFILSFSLLTSGLLWLLKENIRSISGVLLFLVIFSGGTILQSIYLFSMSISHHLLCSGLVVWSWHAFIKDRMMLSGMIFSLAFAVHSPSAIPPGFIFLTLLLWEGDTWEQKLKRLALFAISALPVTIYFLLQAMTSEGGALTFSTSPAEMKALVTYRNPELLEPLWKTPYGTIAAVWFLFLPAIFYYYRRYFSATQFRIMCAISGSAVIYTLTVQTLIIFFDIPLLWLLSFKGMEVISLIQFQILLAFLHRYSLDVGGNRLYVLACAALLVALLANSITIFILGLLLFFWTTSTKTFSELSRQKPGNKNSEWQWNLAAATVVIAYLLFSNIYPHYAKEPTNSPLKAAKLAYWQLLESPKIEPILMGKQFMPKEWKLAKFPPARRSAASFIKNAQADPNELIAYGWRDNWWIMGFRTLANRGIFVDWDGAGEVRSASKKWVHEWYRRYDCNRDFFSFPIDEMITQERRTWVYSGPQEKRVVWSEIQYMHKTDEKTFLQAAQKLYDTNVRWIVHLGPFPRKTDTLEIAFHRGDVWLYRLSDPGITLPPTQENPPFVLPPVWYKIKKWELDQS